MRSSLLLILCLVGLLALPELSLPAYAAIDIGQPAPLLDAQDLKGQRFDLSVLKGKIVVIHFWATWCPSCREEMPELERFYKEQHDQGIEVLAISVDRARARSDVIKMMQNYSFPAAMMDDISTNGFGSPQALPITYIIDASGVVRMKFTPDEAMLTADMLTKTITELKH